MKGKTPFKPLNQRGLLHFLTPVIVAVLIASAGMYFILASHAATPCRDNTYSYAPNTYKSCVANAQAMLNEFWAVGSVDRFFSPQYKGAQISVDGYFGSGTEKQVNYYKGRAGLSENGSLNKSTWTDMCSDALVITQSTVPSGDTTVRNYIAAGRSAAHDSGC